MRLFVQNIDNKFITNLIASSSPNIQIMGGNVSNNLYKIHYNYKFDAYVFVLSLITPEIYQFINEFYTEHRMIIYQDISENLEIIEKIKDKIICLTEDDNLDYGIKIPVLINDKLFFDHNKTHRLDAIACFIEEKSESIKKLEKILYPNSKDKIHIFSKSLDHPQNLGPVSEQEKAEILNYYKNYLSIDNYYEAEALSCGANLISIDDDGSYYAPSVNISEAQTYTNFLYQVLS